ncbi:MAG: hypothetical protein HPY83_12270 [Anaerolineae bacterium]|nr:hypothetical protein [Anaerolineae bacterium]
MSGNWWQRPVRMLRVDNAPDFDSLKHADLEAMARSRRDDWRINCEWVVGSFGWQGRGYLTSFQSPKFETWPRFGDFDYLRSYVPHAHRYGIRVLSYLNMHWFAYEFADQHPGWEQITSTGEAYGRLHPLYGNGTTFCVNSPWRDWAFTMIREAMKTGIDGVFLDGPVIYPDSCYCQSCQTLFRQLHGADIPHEDWRDPLWREFIEFREDSMARFLADARQAVKNVNADGVIFLNGGNWPPSSWRVARDIQKLGPYEDFNGAEAFFHHGRRQNDYEYMMAAKYLSAGGKPAVVFMHYMNGSWHYRLIDPKEVQLGIAQTVAGGANPWLALIRSALQSQPEGNQPPRELFAFLDDHEQYYTDLESAAQVAVLFSSRTGRHYLSVHDNLYRASGSAREENLVVDIEQRSVEELSARKRQCETMLTAACEGYFHLLARSHVPFDVILDQDLVSGKLDRYKVLILPDAACLTCDAVAAIRRFVERGGSLLSSFEAGMYDGAGSPSDSMLDLLGIEAVEGAFPVARVDNYSEAVRDHWGFHRGALIERGPYALQVRPREGTETPAVLHQAVDRPYVALKGPSPHPAVLLSRHGQGKVVYFAEAVGAFFSETYMSTTEQRFQAALAHLLGDSYIQLDAPRSVTMNVFRQPQHQRLLIHLVNNGHDARPVSEFLPAHDLVLRLKEVGGPVEVYSLREKETLTAARKGSGIEVRLPRLTLYEVIVVEAAK